ncbi:MAG: hypothetical protein ACLGI3_06725 [Actinomycetes bacterium]
MPDHTAPAHRRTGAAALAAGVLMFGSVASELIWNVQRPDGSVSDVPGFLLFIGGFGLGTAALALAVLGLGRDEQLSRAGRVGRRLTLTGAGLLTVFAAVFLVTGLATGTPQETAFWLFLLGFVLLVAGSVPLGLGLRSSALVGRWWAAVPVAGLGALVAMLTLSPWHELGLFTFDAAWALVGLRILRSGASVREAAPSS